MVRVLRRVMGEATLDVHLMIEQPDRYAGDFIEAGADCLNVHLEARHQVARTLASIRERGCRAGLAINPATLLKHAIPLLPLCDQLICMTVNPGFGGQAFLPEVLPKIREARDVIVLQNYNVDITVDGGVSDATAASCSAARISSPRCTRRASCSRPGRTPAPSSSLTSPACGTGLG